MFTKKFGFNLQTYVIFMNVEISAGAIMGTNK